MRKLNVKYFGIITVIAFSSFLISYTAKLYIDNGVDYAVLDMENPSGDHPFLSMRVNSEDSLGMYLESLGRLIIGTNDPCLMVYPDDTIKLYVDGDAWKTGDPFWYEESDARLKNDITSLKSHAAYKIPDSITVEQIARAALQITDKNKNTTAQLKISTAAYASMPNLKVDTLEINIEEIKLIANMEATLYCPLNSSSKEFIIIRPIGDTLQVLTPENDYSALWQWDIIAKKVGEFPLNLKVQGKVDDQKGKSQSINMPVFTKNVMVVAEPNYVRSALISLGGLFTLSLGFFLFFKLKRKPISKSVDNQKLNTKNINQIRDKIQGGHTKQAIEMILNESENLSSKSKNRLSTHLSELKDYSEKYNLGMIDIEQKNKAINRINHSVLETLDEFEA